eukprot:CAMPEP_0201529618 /NCGR_PEP_ID=MMETSP0161_2-20130828/42315_1 /ASSEMBLY_ACC=CAM_ASM_000251 /TAXON_ID=180227 /ORGANISM="Neoparamoeba aestuarina, Strain SoJaBio B1-5/56/2" /LENGTH=480 /DNA_ID=CAMNT_0047931521 /DNA_START=20 /DNA_END=1462 /DNA_ORIENTATION=+
MGPGSRLVNEDKKKKLGRTKSTSFKFDADRKEKRGSKIDLRRKPSSSDVSTELPEEKEKEGDPLAYCDTSDIIAALTSDDNVDLDLRSAFFMTYTTFSNPMEIIEHLNNRLNEKVGDQQLAIRRLRVVAVVKHWLEEDYMYLMEKDDVVHALTELNKTIGAKQENVGKSLMTALESKKALYEKEKENVRKQKELIFDPNLGEFDLSWQKFDPKLVSLSLTYYEFFLYEQVKASDFIHWNKKTKEVMCKDIQAMIHLSNRVSAWVTTVLVQRTKLTDRVTLLVKFIDLADELLKLNNFSSLMAVIAGVNNSSFRRMKKTWGQLPAEDLKRFEKVEEIMSHNLCFANYRAYIRNCAPPCIPYVGVYLTDLTFIDEGNKDSNKEGKTNFGKRKMAAAVLNTIKLYQNTKYSEKHPLKKNNFVPNFLDIKLFDEEQCYKYSKMVEPKDTEVAMEQVIGELEKQEKEIAALKEKLAKLETDKAKN